MDELHGLRVREVLPLGHFDPGVDDPQPRAQVRRRLFQLLNLHRPSLSQTPRLRRLFRKYEINSDFRFSRNFLYLNAPAMLKNARMVPVQRIEE